MTTKSRLICIFKSSKTQMSNYFSPFLSLPLSLSTISFPFPPSSFIFAFTIPFSSSFPFPPFSLPLSPFLFPFLIPLPHSSPFPYPFPSPFSFVTFLPDFIFSTLYLSFSRKNFVKYLRRFSIDVIYSLNSRVEAVLQCLQHNVNLDKKDIY